MKLLTLHNIFLSYIPTQLYDSVFLFLMKYRAYTFKKSGFEVVFGKYKTSLRRDREEIILSNKHLVYLKDVRNMFDYYFNALASSKKNNFWILDFSTPRKHTFKNTGISFYFSSIPEDDWEIDEYLAKYRIKKGDVIFDIGSYCGYSVYNFSKKTGPKGMIYSFEPDDTNFRILIKNIKDHKLNNVTTSKKALWSKSTTITFFEEGSLGSSVTEMGYRPNQTVHSKIDAISLEDAFNSFGLNRLNFVKMDAEGAEIEIIKGSLDFIKKHKINFAISCHPRNVKGQTIITSEILCKLFDQIGYRTQVKKFDYRTYEATLLYAYK